MKTRLSLRWVALVIVILAVFGLGVETANLRPYKSSVVPEGMINPSYADLVEFLDKDNTNLNTYSKGYNCVDFSIDLYQNLRWSGFTSTRCNLDFSNGEGHEICVVYTSDKGWVFVEPQFDSIVYPKIGGNYRGHTITNITILRENWLPVSVLGNIGVNIWVDSIE